MRFIRCFQDALVNDREDQALMVPKESITSETVKLPSKRVIFRGIQIFVFFSLIGFGVGYWWKKPPWPTEIFSELNWQFAVLLLPLIAVDFVIGGMRYRVLLNGRALPRVSLWNCMRSNWANIFLGATTPFQTGGGPAQLFILWRSGVRISEGLLTSMVNLAGTLIFFLMSSVVALLLLPDDLFSPRLTTMINGGFAVVITVTTLVLIVMFFPRTVLWCLHRCTAGFMTRRLHPAQWGYRFIEKLEGGIDRFGNAFRYMIRNDRLSLFLVILLTSILYFNKFTIGYVIIRALGEHVQYAILLGLQCIQLIIVYFAPTPGASGVAELSSVWLLDTILPTELLLVYAVLWRFFTTILSAIIGGFVLLLSMRRVGLSDRSSD